MSLHFVSVSAGKDSQETANQVLDAHGGEDVRLLFGDTGNEHSLTYSHLDYLEGVWRRPIVRLRADFADDIEHRRAYVRLVWPTKGVPREIVEQALTALVPSGIPFLDLCLWKGRFPSRMAQFCTQELKRRPIEAYMADAIIEAGCDLHDVHSWQGVRRDESGPRKNLAQRERAAEGWWIERPIVSWTAQQVVDACIARGQRLNPLYSMGMRRVGCMPCINCGKNELLEIAQRFPDVVDRVRVWEAAVAQASKRGAASFFAAPDKDGRGEREGRNIDERVAWARTSRGGMQLDLTRSLPSPECSSSYGLCETSDMPEAA